MSLLWTTCKISPWSPSLVSLFCIVCRRHWINRDFISMEEWVTAPIEYLRMVWNSQKIQKRGIDCTAFALSLSLSPAYLFIPHYLFCNELEPSVKDLRAQRTLSPTATPDSSNMRCPKQRALHAVLTMQTLNWNKNERVPTARKSLLLCQRLFVQCVSVEVNMPVLLLDGFRQHP